MAVNKSSVTAIIPAFNEEKTIGEIVSVISPLVEKVMVIDDASTDKTALAVNSLKLENVAIIRNKKNFGKSESIKRMVGEITTDYVMFADADLVGFKGEHVKLLLDNIDDKTPMVIGLRDKKSRVWNKVMEHFLKISGERVVRSDIVRKACEHPFWTKYNMELVLNDLVGSVSKIKCVRMKGVNDRWKWEKWGDQGVLDFLVEFCDIFSKAGSLKFERLRKKIKI